MSVTIEEVMTLARLYAMAHAASDSGQIVGETQALAALQACTNASMSLRAAITALVAQARDEEAEACAEVCEQHPDCCAGMDADFLRCAEAIRARIAGRKA